MHLSPEDFEAEGLGGDLVTLTRAGAEKVDELLNDEF